MTVSQTLAAPAPAPTSASLAPTDFDAARIAMVASQLRPNAVIDPHVIAAMARVPREDFLPADRAAMAYTDRAVPIGRGRHANPPLATGRLLNEAYLRATDRVLLIGAARGYTAAVLAQIVADVVAVESDPVLAEAARVALAGIANVTLVEGALGIGHAAAMPYDVLVIDGAIEDLSPTLASQVRMGGRIVTGVIDRGVTRLAAGRVSESSFGLVDFLDAECVVLPGFSTPAGFTF